MGPGETFDYRFTPQDAGTFWYHPHCNTFDQLQRGLSGIVVVAEREDPGFDTDLAVMLRDFRLDGDGQFLPLSRPRDAARGGTLGTVMTANWQVDPAFPVATGGLTRLRLCNTDVTRVHRLFLTGATGRVIALDGHPLDTPLPLPDRSETALPLAPGQRMDLALAVPPSEGAEIALMTHRRNRPERLARLRAQGAHLNRGLAEMRPLPASPLAAPDLAKATPIDFVFGWSPAGDAEGGSSLCGETGQRFWSINRIASAADGPDPGAPLAELRLGQSYILRLRNETQNDHPIHLHGLAFRILRSDRRAVLSHWTDTALLLAQETVEVALVADNPGDWVFHCHVIEHQKTGLSGYLRVG
jgi:FtsP/CotA-like multicopper oxidase with cupredoxin domain